MTSPGGGVSIFTSPYLSAEAPALGEVKGLINKKFLKLRHENENERIKLKKKNKTKSKKAYKKIETINININKLENSININNIDNIETDKKHIIDVDEVLTTVKNNFENKLINKFNNNININNNNNDSYNDDKNDIILIKKRKIDSHKKHSMTIQHKNKAINIYYPNENMIKNNKTKNEDVLYIDDSEEISEKNDKDNAKSFNINNNINNEDKNSKSAKGNKKKLSLGKIKFSNVENDSNDNPKNIKELTTNRGLIYKKE